jgi:hypothetical protein
MTPQDKAKELVDKFTVVGLQQRNEGIQCAVIAVDEIVKEIQCNEFDFQSNVPMSVYTYWKNVKGTTPYHKDVVNYNSIFNFGNLIIF